MRAVAAAQPATSNITFTVSACGVQTDLHAVALSFLVKKVVICLDELCPLVNGQQVGSIAIAETRTVVLNGKYLFAGFFPDGHFNVRGLVVFADAVEGVLANAEQVKLNIFWKQVLVERTRIGAGKATPL